jgi:uncharacterized ferritin-like protein (DUF455 family)
MYQNRWRARPRRSDSTKRIFEIPGVVRISPRPRRARRRAKAGEAGENREHLAEAAAHIEYVEVDLALDRVVRDLRRSHNTFNRPRVASAANCANVQLADALKGPHVVSRQATVALD